MEEIAGVLWERYKIFHMVPIQRCYFCEDLRIFCNREYTMSFEGLREAWILSVVDYSPRKGMRSYSKFYNQDRFHQTLDSETPNMQYESFQIDYATAS